MRTTRWHIRTIAVAVAAALLLAACGDDDDPAAEDENGEEAFDPNGVFRRAYNLEAGGGLSFDPGSMGTGQYAVTYPVHDSLLKLEPDGTFSPNLATEATIVDPRTIEVTLRPNLKFSDGSPLDAQTAADSIIRARDLRAPGIRFAELAYVTSVDVTSPTEFTIRLSQPFAGLFYYLLADVETAPVARATMNTPGDHRGDVIAAGPFKLESYQPGARVRMVKNEHYWDAENVKLAAIEYIHTDAPAAFINAVQAGQADWAQVLTVQDAEAFGDGFTTESRVQFGPYQFNMCIREGTPLGDKRVRQALNFATDREEINEVVFQGKSEPAWGFFPDGHLLHYDDLDGVYEHNPQRARELLAQAGYANGLTLTSIVESAGGVTTAMNEVMQAQWAEVGVTLNIVPSANTTADWYLANGSKGDLNIVPLIRGGAGSLTRNLMSTAFANVCKTPMPALDAAAQGILGLDQTSDEAVEAWEEMQEIIIEDVVWGVMTVFPMQTFVYSDDVGGVEYRVDAINQLQPDVTKLFIRQ